MKEPYNVQHLSPDEVQAEAIFTSSTKHLESGRCSVTLPFKHSHPILRDSKNIALKQSHSLNIDYHKTIISIGNIRTL